MCEAACKVASPTRGPGIYATTRWRLFPIHRPDSSARHTIPWTERLPNVELLLPDGERRSCVRKPVPASGGRTIYNLHPDSRARGCAPRAKRVCGFSRDMVGVFRTPGHGAPMGNRKLSPVCYTHSLAHSHHVCLNIVHQETWPALRRKSSSTPLRPSR